MEKATVVESVLPYRNMLLTNKNFKDVNPRVCGSQECQSGNRYGPHTRNYYLIHYVVSGQGVLQTPTGTYPVHQGQIFIIRPGEVTIYTADEQDPWKYIWIGFDGRQGKRLDIIPSPVMDFQANTFFEMCGAENLMSMREEFLAGKIFEVLAVLFECSKKPDVIELIENYISTHYQSNIRIEDIARLVKYDRHYLARVFKERKGVTLTEYITEKRMKEATRLLRLGTLVSETAKMLGYEDQFVFSKAFKRYFGMSPQGYRRSLGINGGGRKI